MTVVHGQSTPPPAGLLVALRKDCSRSKNAAANQRAGLPDAIGTAGLMKILRALRNCGFR